MGGETADSDICSYQPDRFDYNATIEMKGGEAISMEVYIESSTTIEAKGPVTLSKGSESVVIVGEVTVHYRTYDSQCDGSFPLPEELVDELNKLESKAHSIIGRILSP